MAHTGSFQLGRVANIPIKVHWTFGLLILGVIGAFMFKKVSLINALYFFVPVFGLFLSVILHELGHAIAAKQFDIKTRDIIISPIGGLARLDNLPEEPKKELLIAIAGPIVNLGLALFFGILALSTDTLTLIHPGENLSFEQPIIMLSLMFFLNLALFGFNLIPAFPMDGGRVLRALLAMKLDYYKATLIAARIGQIISLVFIVLSFWFGNFVLLLAAGFIFFMADQEIKKVKMEHHLYQYNAQSIMRTDFTRINSADQMSRPISLLNQGEEKNFLVVNDHDQVIGVLHQLFIQDAQKEQLDQALVHDYLSTNYRHYTIDTSLKKIRDEMNTLGMSIVLVTSHDKLVGVLDRNDFDKLYKK